MSEFKPIAMQKVIRADDTLSPTAKYLLFCAVLATDNKSGRVRVSQEKLAEVAGLGESTVRKYLHEKSPVMARYFHAEKAGRQLNLTWRPEPIPLPDSGIGGDPDTATSEQNTAISEQNTATSEQDTATPWRSSASSSALPSASPSAPRVARAVTSPPVDVAERTTKMNDEQTEQQQWWRTADEFSLALHATTLLTEAGLDPEKHRPYAVRWAAGVSLPLAREPTVAQILANRQRREAGAG